MIVECKLQENKRRQAVGGEVNIAECRLISIEIYEAIDREDKQNSTKQ